MQYWVQGFPPFPPNYNISSIFLSECALDDLKPDSETSSYTHDLLNVCHREYFSINIHFPNPPLRALSGFQTMDLSHCYTVYITFCIKFFLHNHTLHHRRALLQSTDQLQAGLPSNQDYNNTVFPSYSAAVNYLGCRTSLIFPSLNPWGIFINAQALHQIQSGGLIMRSQPSLAWFKC